MSELPKVSQQLSDSISENLQKLATLFPAAVKDGELDIEALREELGDFAEIQPGDEKYELNWAGKQAAKKEAFQPLLGKTLKYVAEDSKDPDTTENIYIEGDNLEALKLLRQNYYGAIKMIYIDPPYNTGKDFVYKDNFKVSAEESDEAEGTRSSSGERLVKNEKSSNRFHANWLDMMYPRLKIAKDLLIEDGVIFISIDDNEIHNLRAVCDEIFGYSNFVAQFVWETEGHSDNQYDVKVNHEYIVAYSRSKKPKIGHVVDPNTKEDSNLWKGFAENSITKNGNANPPSEIILPVGFPCSKTELNLEPNTPDVSFFEEVERIGYVAKRLTKGYQTTYPIRKDHLCVVDGKLAAPCRVFSGWANADKLKQFIKNGCETINEGNGNQLRFYISERGVVYYRRDRDKARNIVSVLRNFGTTEQMKSELARLGIPFDYPKPKQLLKYLLKIGAEEDGIVMDFFAGSATTTHSLFEVLSELGNTKLSSITVQYPERLSNTDAKQQEAYEFCIRNELKPLVSELSKERIRRAGDKLKADLVEKSKQATEEEKSSNHYLKNPDLLDIGFKCFRIEDTQINWLKNDLSGGELVDADISSKDQLDFVPGFTDLDVVYEIMLRQSSIPLTQPISTLSEIGSRTYLYGESYLICLEEDITKAMVEQLAQLEPTPLKFIFRDSAFGKDIAFKDETFRRLNAEIAKHTDGAESYTVEFI